MNIKQEILFTMYTIIKLPDKEINQIPKTLNPNHQSSLEPVTEVKKMFVLVRASIAMTRHKDYCKYYKEKY